MKNKIEIREDGQEVYVDIRVGESIDFDGNDIGILTLWNGSYMYDHDYDIISHLTEEEIEKFQLCEQCEAHFEFLPELLEEMKELIFERFNVKLMDPKIVDSFS